MMMPQTMSHVVLWLHQLNSCMIQPIDRWPPAGHVLVPDALRRLHVCRNPPHGTFRRGALARTDTRNNAGHAAVRPPLLSISDCDDGRASASAFQLQQSILLYRLRHGRQHGSLAPWSPSVVWPQPPRRNPWTIVASQSRARRSASAVGVGPHPREPSDSARRRLRTRPRPASSSTGGCLLVALLHIESLPSLTPASASDVESLFYARPFRPRRVSRCRPRSSSPCCSSARLCAAGASDLCYTPDGLSDSSQWACGNKLRGSFSTCCDDGWACLSNGLCADPSDNSTFRRGTCTDSTWSSPVCPHVCLSQARIAPAELVLCTNDPANASFCCAGDAKCSCRTKTGVVRLDDPTISTVTTAGFGATTTTETTVDPFTRFTTSTDLYPYPTYNSPSYNNYDDRAGRNYSAAPVVSIVVIVVIILLVVGVCLGCCTWCYRRRRGIALRRAEAAWVETGGRTVAAFRPARRSVAAVPVIAGPPCRCRCRQRPRP